MNFKHKEELKNELFKEKTREEREKKAQIKEGFLVHGIAAEKWEGAKVQNLKDFIEKLDDGIVQETLVNLAAEMAKKCKKEDKR